MITIHQIANKPVPSNCFVLYDKAVGRKCVVVDPGGEDNEDLSVFFEKMGLIPQYIILTHEHFDHCWGVNQLRADYPAAKLVSSLSCSVAIQNKKKNYSVFHEQPGFDVGASDIILEDINWSLDWECYSLRFYPAQGHTVSGVIFTVNRYIFTGDELIKGIRTVTKLHTGSREKLAESIDLLKSMKGKGLIVCPGHGDCFDLDDYDLGKALETCAK